MNRWILCSLVIMCSTAIPVRASTYYVSTAGDDSNSGNARAPFRHLSKAAAAARQPGDRVIVMDGTYDNEGQVANSTGGGSVVRLTYSGTSSKPITFRALNRGKAILDAMNTSGSGCNGAWAYFDLRNASYIVIQGFVIQHGCYNGIRSNGSAHDVTIRWNEIRNIGNWLNPGGASSPSGIFLNNTEYNFTFEGNIFHDIGGGTDNQEHGIYTFASSIDIVNNVFYNQVHGYDITVAGGVNILIANNTFAFPNPNRDGHVILWDDGHAGTVSNVFIRNNIFYSPGRTAVVTSLAGPIAGTCNIDHNLTNALYMYDGHSPCDLANNFISTDPKLVNTSSGPYDFHVQASSPAVAAGVSLPNITVDCDGAPRSKSAAFDLGAYTFLPVKLSPIASVGNGASFVAASVAPGEIIAIRGSGMGPDAGIAVVLDDSGMVDTILGSTRVLFDGVPAPMLYASAVQLTAVVPYGVADKSSTHVEVEFDGAKSPGLDVPVVNSAPGIFTLDSSGRGQGCILDQNYSPNSVGTPASKGSVIAIYGTGEGQTNPPGVDGLLADDLRIPVLPVSVTIGGLPAEVLYAGSAPGLVAGVLQVDARVPVGIDSGSEVPVILTVGSTSSPGGVTVAVPYPSALNLPRRSPKGRSILCVASQAFGATSLAHETRTPGLTR